MACYLPVDAQLANPEYYSLFHSTSSASGTQLIDSDGTTLHTWNHTLSAPSGTTAYLREDGLLLRSGQNGGVPGGFLAGSFGSLQLVNWDGGVVWEFTLQEQGVVTLHHDMALMPNGNILATVWDFIQAEELIPLGWQAPTGTNGVWMERIIEIEPDLTDGSSEIVWSWNLRDHLVQDFDEDVPTFGTIASNPGKVDLNFNTSIRSGDYFHISGIDFNPERDEIVLCPNNINELWVIDHSTTTEEAATSEGGNRGRGGEILYRWGNPTVYDHGGGPVAANFLQRAHDPRWLLSPETGEWILTVHNNNRVDDTPGSNDSQALQLTLPIDEQDNYLLEQQSTFGPLAPEVLYEIDPNDPFFNTPFMGGAQVLANGNILITLALSAELVEVDPSGNVVWRTDTGGGFIFKAQNYPINYAGYGPSLPFNYNVWRTAHFGGVGSLEGELEEDPDEDGRSNIMEYYLGSGPNETDLPFNLEVRIDESGDGARFVGNYTRLANVPDVQGRFEFSRNLDPWVDESAAINLNEVITPEANSREEASFQTTLEEGDARGFVRLLFETTP